MSSESGPYLILAAFCEQVIEDKAGVLSLIRVVDRLNISATGPDAPDNMPRATLTWTLVISLKSGQARGTHMIRIQPELPSGIRLDPLILSGHFEGGNRGQNLLTRMQMVLEMPGIYWFRIYFDDLFMTQIPVEVIYSRTVMPRPPLPPGHQPPQ